MLKSISFIGTVTSTYGLYKYKKKASGEMANTYML